ncbi:MAG: UxaA family hydrolase [Bacillota bacterium]
MVKNAVVADIKDNVATATTDIKEETKVIMFVGGEELSIQVQQEIPFGHKFALRNISKGDHVIKYSESIGIASRDIQIGEHVHVHNVDSDRGRGDLK